MVAIDQPNIAKAFLAKLRDPRRPRIDARRIAIVVAHPDDETYGCGAALARLDGVALVHVTDGAPRDGVDARANGFQNWQAYAAARQEELRAAMAVGGPPSRRMISMGLPDQQVHLHLPELFRALAALFVERSTSIVLTHAFEGGHPDHDSVAFAVSQAARSIAVVEMPYYRLGPAGQLSQSFLGVKGAGDEHRIEIDEQESERKKRMLAAYKTQQGPLSQVSLTFETFRLSPPYDFSKLPNGGRILYEALFDWGISARDVRDRFLPLIEKTQEKPSANG